MPRHHREWHYKMGRIVCLSVRPYVRGVPRPNSRKERPSKPKISRMEVHHTGIQITYLEVKGQVTRPINAHTVNAQYLPNGKAYEVQSWSMKTGITYRQAPRLPRSKVKVTRPRLMRMTCCHGSCMTCWPICREQKVQETPKLVGRSSTARAIMRTSFKVKGQRSRSPGLLLLIAEMRHICQSQRSWWRGHMVRLTGGEQVTHKSRTKSNIKSKIGR